MLGYSVIMPIYEFLCQRCHEKSSVLVRNISSPVVPTCPFCGSSEMVRVISSFAYHKSTQAVWDESGPPRNHADKDYYKDPRNIGRWTEQRVKEMGVEMPPKVQEKIRAAREGVLPPELGV